MILSRIAGLLMMLAAVSMVGAGCMPPAQRGLVRVAPGASERFSLAMRMGYLGTFEREMVPGQVRRALFDDQLPTGEARTGKLGDYVLENGHVLAAISNVDGTARGGRLIDLGRKPATLDGLDGLDHEVLGGSVVYDALKTGFDETTNTAYVEVSGRIDRGARDGSLFTVSTRYDAAPGIEGIVVHTHIKLDRGALDPEEQVALFDERLHARDAEGPIVDATNAVGATMGSKGAYMLRPLFDGAAITSSSTAPRMLVGVESAPPLGDSIVITRIVTPLERPDTAALAVAVARIDGRGIGDIEVKVTPRTRAARFPMRGHLAFVSSDGARFDVCGVETRGEDSHFAATIPSGRYTVFFENERVASLGDELEIEPDRVAIVSISVGNRDEGIPATSSACITRAAHDPPR